MSQSSVTVNQSARPLRIAFLVDKHTYIEAMNINTALWGGILNPLIPVKKSDTKKEQSYVKNLLNDFDPDVLVNMTGKTIPYISEIYRERRFKDKIISKGQLFHKDGRSGKDTLSLGISTMMVMRDRYAKLNGQVEDTGNALDYPIRLNSKNKRWEGFLSATIGIYPKNTPLDFTMQYLNVLNFNIAEFNPSAFEQAFSRGSRPFDLTLYELESDGGGGSLSSHILYLGNATDWKDLIDYWNIRASGTWVRFIPFEEYKEFRFTATQTIASGRYPINPSHYNSAALVTGGKITKEQLEEYLSWLDLKDNSVLSIYNVPTKRNNIHPAITRDFDIRYWYSAEKEEDLIIDDEDSLQFFSTKPGFLSNSRLFRERAFATVIRFSGYYGDKYCFGFPNDTNVEWLVQHAMLEHNNSRLSKEGVIRFNRYTRNRVFFRPIDNFAVITALFKTAGFKINVSQPGRITQNLIEFLGGIQGARLLKVDGIRKAIKELNKKSLTSTELVKIIGESWHPEENKSLVLKAGGGWNLTATKAFDALLASKLIRPGIDFRCKRCGITNWYSVKDFGEQFECIYCFLKQDIPRLDKVDWKYTTNGLVRVQDEGYGSIPVILALWRFDHLHDYGSSSGLASMELRKGDFNCEIDFFYIATNSSGSYELVIGEAKGFESISDKVIAKMKKVADSFEDSPIITFTVLKDELSESEKNRIRSLIVEGYKVIILTRKELEPYDLFDRFDSLPHQYGSSLSDLQTNTQTLNL